MKLTENEIAVDRTCLGLVDRQIEAGRMDTPILRFEKKFQV